MGSKGPVFILSYHHLLRVPVRKLISRRGCLRGQAVWACCRLSPELLDFAFLLPAWWRVPLPRAWRDMRAGSASSGSVARRHAAARRDAQ